jgi:hypothetical protein
MHTTPEVRPMTDDRRDDDVMTDLVTSRWEPCHAFAPEVADSQDADSQICGECGWLHDDHERIAAVRRLPVRPSRALPRRLAS